MNKDCADEIAKRSRGTPRIAGRLLRRIRDIFSVDKIQIINLEFVKNALSQLNIDESGLDVLDRKYLLSIIKKYQGGPVGLDTISAVLSEEKDMIEEVIEPFLLQKGYIERSKRGRIVTSIAWKHFGLNPKISN